MGNDAHITISQAQHNDLAELCALRNNEQLFRGYLDECDGAAAHFLLARIGSRLVGFGLVYLAVTRNGKKKSHLPKLSDLYVDARYRRRGVATALVRAREALAKQYGHTHMFVSIDPVESAPMLALARKLGYVAVQAEPYAVSAVYYDANGQAFNKHYTRLDLSRRLT